MTNILLLQNVTTKLSFVSGRLTKVDSTMHYSVFLIVLIILGTVTEGRKQKKKGSKKNKEVSPPHCTQLTKDTDFVSRFKFTYPIALIVQGHHEAYQQLFCVNPSAVNKAVTKVCDWAAPPQVQFTMGDEYLHVIRQDHTGQFSGNAVITTYQLCSHNISHQTMQGERAMPFVTQF